MSWDRGFWWPYGALPLFTGTSGTIDATGETVACVGRLNIAGKATNKTLDTTGASAIRFCVGSSPVFDNAGSVFTVGFQGIDKSAFPVRPNGTWGARAVITTAANTTPTLTTSANSHAAVPTAGTSTFSHGDEVCFVMEMTTRAGTDSLVCLLAGVGGGFGTGFPAIITNVTGSWVGMATTGGLLCEITFSDGTLGTIELTPAGVPTNLTWSDATNPDEQGLIFQVPFACTVDAVCFPNRIVDATSDMQFDLTSTPNGTPASLIGGPIALNAENLGLAAVEAYIVHTLAADINLAANTDYCLAVKATGAGNIRFAQLNMISAGSRIFVGPGGTTMGATTRNGGSGAYAAANTSVLNPLAVRISGISAGSSGGLLIHPGMAGGMRG